MRELPAAEAGHYRVRFDDIGIGTRDVEKVVASKQKSISISGRSGRAQALGGKLVVSPVIEDHRLCCPYGSVVYMVMIATITCRNCEQDVTHKII
jgi:hypothetical protein